jgi:hypothetical protein
VLAFWARPHRHFGDGDYGSAGVMPQRVIGNSAIAESFGDHPRRVAHSSGFQSAVWRQRQIRASIP